MKVPTRKSEKEKIKQENESPWRGWKTTLDGMVRVGHLEDVTFELRPEYEHPLPIMVVGENGTEAKNSRGWNSKCEGPEAGTGWVSFRTGRKAARAGAQGAWGKVAWWCLSRRWDRRTVGHASSGKASTLLSMCVEASERF